MIEDTNENLRSVIAEIVKEKFDNLIKHSRELAGKEVMIPKPVQEVATTVSALVGTKMSFHGMVKGDAIAFSQSISDVLLAMYVAGLANEPISTEGEVIKIDRGAEE